MKNLYLNLSLTRIIKPLVVLFLFFASIVNVNAQTAPTINANTISTTTPIFNCGSFTPSLTGNVSVLTNNTWTQIGDPGVGDCGNILYKWEYSNDNVTWIPFPGSAGVYSTANQNPTSTPTFSYLGGAFTYYYIHRVVFVSCTQPSYSQLENWSSYIRFRVYPPFSASITSQTNLSCFGNTNGAATVTVTGGFPNYNYYWSTTPPQNTVNTPTMSNTATGLPGGTYSVTTVDVAGCTRTLSVTITQPTAVVATIGSVTQITCASNGAIALNASGGTGTLTFSWTGPSGFTSTSQNITNLLAGTYNVTVTDANGCTGTASQTLTAPATLSITNGTPTHVSCNGGSNGATNISVSGGTGTKTYLWSNSATTQNISGLTAGTYNVTVTDANGCQATASVTINQPAVLTASIVGTQVSCFGGSTGSANLTVSGGTATYTYLWSNAAITEDLTNIPIGTYNVTVTDAKGCQATASVTITQPAAALAASIVGTDVLCRGTATGAANLSVSGGTATYTYLWSNAAITEDLTNVLAGTYNVTVTDAKGCQKTASVTINQPAAVLSASIAGTNVACYNGTTGAANLTVNGGTGSRTYYWSYSEDPTYHPTTEDLSGLEFGVYSVVVTDANGCQATASVTINQPLAVLAFVDQAHNDLTCFQNATGTALVTVTGGTPSYTYAWVGPNGFTGNTNEILNLQAGTYTVTVTDANQCQIIWSVNVLQPALLTAVLNTKTNVLCYGQLTGAIDVNVNGGTPTYTYAWLPSGNTQDLSGIGAGTYNLTVTDVKGCQATTSVTITQPAAALSASIIGTNVLCYGNATGVADLTVAGGTATYTYLWSNSATTEDLTNIIAGTYNVTVTDANSCTKTATVTITQSGAALTASILGTNVQCFGTATGNATLTVNGGTGTKTYLWSNAATTQNLTNVVAGTYAVTVTDANGCQATASVTITQPAAALTASILGTNVLCFGGNNGAATLTVNGGTGTRTYLWSNAATTQNLTNIIAGTYTVMVTDANGCHATASVTITQPDAALTASIEGTNVLCYNGATGAAYLTVNGGTGSRTYYWSYSEDPTYHPTTEDLSNLEFGVYSVVVTDANGCQATASVTINQPLAVLAFVDQAHNDLTCFQNGTGTALVTVTGGTPSYTYAWVGPNGFTGNTNEILNLQAGTYTVTVTDANGCQIIWSVNVLQPALLTVGLQSKTNVLCYGQATGAIDINVNGGTPTYTYAWLPTANTQDLTGIAAGTYSLIVTDVKGCQATFTETITEPQSPLTAGIIGTDVLCYNGATGTANLTVNGGTGSRTYYWSYSEDPTYHPTTEDLNNLEFGVYSVVVTDANGCQATASITINQPLAVLAFVDQAHNDLTCFQNGTGTALVTVTGGTPSYTYAWVGPNGFTGNTNEILNLQAGTYTVTVTDANQCQIIWSVNVLQPALLTVGLQSKTNVLCYGQATGAIDINVNGGTPTYTYAWLPSGNTQDLSGIAAGTYSLIVTDVKGCQATFTETITEPQSPLTAGIVGTDVLCYNGTNGAADLTVNGGTGSRTYYWSYSEDPTYHPTTEDLSNLEFGVYSVVVTDANGCQATASITINQPLAVLAFVDQAHNDLTCFENGTGTALVTVTGGTPSYTYAWVGPNGFTGNTNEILNLQAGTYTVTVTDANGCQIIWSVNVLQPALLTITLQSKTDVLCYGQATGAIDVNVNGGTPTYTYAWLPSGNTQDLSGIAAGTYSLTVTDVKGCQATFTETITEPQSPLTAGIIGTDVLCYNGATGAADLTVNGGTGSRTYYWSYSEDPTYHPTTEDLSNLEFGVYSVVVTDANGCQATASITINQPLAVLAFVDQAHNDLTCFQNGTGTALVTVTGGTPSYTYAWVGPNGFTGNTNEILNLQAGTYTVTITDANGCQIIWSVNVLQPALLTAVVTSKTDVSCFGGSNGTVDVTVAGGTPTYTYAWYNNLTFVGATEDLSGLSIGTYTFTVTDVKGCQATTTVTIEQPTELLAVIDSVHNVNCITDFTGIAYASATGGTLSYTYSWNTVPVQTTATAVNLGVGTYTVTVTDAHGCQASATATITNIYQPPCIELIGPREVCCDEAIPYTEICQPQQPQYTIGIEGSMGYTWQWVIDGGHITNGANTCCPTIVWYCNCTIGWIKLLKTDLATGCWTYDSIQVIVHPKPVPVITGDTIVLTNANPVTYSVPCLPGQLYSWAVVGGTITSGQGSCTITVNWNLPTCEDCPSSVCVTVTSQYSVLPWFEGGPTQIGCDGTTCITVHQMPLPGSCKIFGQVLYDNIIQSIPMNGVTVKLLANGVVKAATTTATSIMELPGDTTYVAGYYEFNNFDCSTASNTLTYTVEISNVSQQTWGGVNATDALMIKNYTVGNITLAPLPKKAADPNLSNTVNATDALLVQLRTVGLVNSFAAGNWVYNYPSIGTYTSTAVIPFNIMVLATGDVNKSHMPNIGYIADNYTALQKEGVSIANSNDEILIPVRVNEALSLGAVTLDLAYMQNLIEVTGLTSPLSGIEYKISNGVIKIAWANPNAVSLQANDILLTLKVKAKDAITNTTDLFSWSNNRTEFADAYGNILSFSNLKVNGIQTDSRSNGISVYPNPFTDNAEVNYNLVETGSVRIVLYNAVGQRIEVLVDENKTAGNYKYNLNTSALQSGVYSCEIIINGQTSNYQKVIKLVKTK